MSYHPSVGRFLERDPIGYSDGTNLYQFESSTPINLLDPTGLVGGPGKSCPPPLPDRNLPNTFGRFTRKCGDVSYEARYECCLNPAQGIIGRQEDYWQTLGYASQLDCANRLASQTYPGNLTALGSVANNSIGYLVYNAAGWGFYLGQAAQIAAAHEWCGRRSGACK